ncbi:DUF4283 domain protein [Trifolium medium]|uniref:DUF4283 domain protein n=1 Tax=Trifolium medium TaxID=97028 RepID=A0A392R123_9FABA|nr:DUF4283 domain protein [Trifolium medium]
MAGLEELHLSDDEDEVLTFDNSQTEDVKVDPALCLIGRFLTNKPIKNHVMKETMANLWQPGRKVSIKEIDRGIYVFQFFHKLDMQRILNGGPWHFDGHLLLLSPVDPYVPPSQVPLFHAVKSMIFRQGS